MKRVLAAALVLACALFRAPLVLAHALLPASIAVEQTGTARYDVTFARSGRAAPSLSPGWPAICRASTPATAPRNGEIVDRFTLQCERSLEGETVRVFGLPEVETSVVLSLKLSGGRVLRALLTPDRASFTVPRRESALSVFRDYVRFGAQHLLTGADHVLFVVGLLFVVRAFRDRILALTAFTLGHSITLCASALSVISVPGAPVELGIAASLIALALSVLDERAASAGGRRAWLMAGGFGLLHGLGFASALSEAGLPREAVPFALFSFNLGVELGQLAVLALVSPMLFVAARFPGRLARVPRLAAYGIGAVAAMWFLERAEPLLRQFPS